MNLQQFKATIPLASPLAWLGIFNSAMTEFSITSRSCQAAFVANVAHETNQLRTFVENLNYSMQGLATTWPSRYAGSDKMPNALAISLAHNPMRIANNVYAGRMGNGNEKSGDGWFYRGAGAIQITGKDAYTACAAYFSMDVTMLLPWLQTPQGAIRSAAWFFATHGCRVPGDKGDFDGVCDLINIGHKTAKQGDAIGYASRLEFYNAYMKAIP